MYSKNNLMKHVLIKKDISERKKYAFFLIGLVSWANKKFIICTVWEFDTYYCPTFQLPQINICEIL